MNRNFWSSLFWLANLPRRVRERLRRRAMTAQLAAAGQGFCFDALTATFVTPHTIRVGNNVFFNLGAYLSGDISIGNNVLFGPHVSVLSGNHLFGIRGKSVRHIRMAQDNPEHIEPTRIEDEVWIGAHSIVLGGLTIGMGAVVGAGSIVTKDIPPYTIAAGNPCKPLRRIFDDNVLVEHLRGLGYDESLAGELVERRRQALQGLKLATIDNTGRYEQFFYHGQLQPTGAN
jgi:acetyltransferase-like isoleucine patch superfamily enzyme